MLDMANMGTIVVITTVPDEILAVKITDALLQQRLAACVHTLPMAKSRYLWKGNIEAADEMTLVIKTVAAQYSSIEAEIRRLHSYEMPEILAFQVSEGSQDYLQWIDDETKRGGN